MSPKISVVIGAYNEEKLLPRCLEAFKNQSYPADKFEVILVDNDSKDSTSQIAKDYGVRVYKYTDFQGIAAVRRYGAEQARGEIIAFTDADSVVPNDWLEKIDTLLSDPNVVCVGGPGKSDKESFFQDFIYWFYDLFHILNHTAGKPLMWGFNMAVKKDAYEEVGKINGSLLAYEDWDLSFRLQKQFGRENVRYIRDLRVKTSTRKQDNIFILIRYAIDGISNYVNFVILRRAKSNPAFNVR